MPLSTVVDQRVSCMHSFSDDIYYCILMRQWSRCISSKCSRRRQLMPRYGKFPAPHAATSLQSADQRTRKAGNHARPRMETQSAMVPSSYPARRAAQTWQVDRPSTAGPVISPAMRFDFTVVHSYANYKDGANLAGGAKFETSQ